MKVPCHQLEFAEVEVSQARRAPVQSVAVQYDSSSGASSGARKLWGGPQVESKHTV
jgi:hypothetical protein